jgi:hypothetical protein
MGAVLVYVGFFLAIIFYRQILLLFSILCGDKETLNDVGNLCEDKVPWRDTIWTAEEKGLPEPEPVKFRWEWQNDDHWTVGDKEGDAK